MEKKKVLSQKISVILFGILIYFFFLPVVFAQTTPTPLPLPTQFYWWDLEPGCYAKIQRLTENTMTPYCTGDKVSRVLVTCHNTKSINNHCYIKAHTSPLCENNRCMLMSDAQAYANFICCSGHDLNYCVSGLTSETHCSNCLPFNSSNMYYQTTWWACMKNGVYDYWNDSSPYRPPPLIP